MAKDPAMLWYWGDWFSGTATLSRHLKGCYMDLLHAQFNAGHLSMDEIQTVLGSDFGTAWPTIQKKFVEDKNGLFYNIRCEEEKIKRQSYTNSRRNNLDKKNHTKPHMDKHMDHHMDNHMQNDMDNHMDNENENKKGRKGKGMGKPLEGKKADQFPTADHIIELTDFEVGTSQQVVKYFLKTDLTPNEILEFFEGFKLINFNGVNFYETRQKIIDHFKNWLKLQKFNNGNKQQSTADKVNPRTVGQDQILGNIHEQLKSFQSGEIYD